MCRSWLNTREKSSRRWFVKAPCSSSCRPIFCELLSTEKPEKATTRPTKQAAALGRLRAGSHRRQARRPRSPDAAARSRSARRNTASSRSVLDASPASGLGAPPPPPMGPA